MTAATITLTEFLLARIADDALEAEGMGQREYYEGGWRDEHVAHILADCAAKRAIMAEHDEAHDCVKYINPEDNRECATLRALASVYADHDEFDPRWAL